MTGLKTYYPEMGQEQPEAEIEASLGHGGKHWFLSTPLVLAGRGVKHLGTDTAETLVPGSRKVGWHRYKVTEAAFERICNQHSVASELLL